MAPTPAALTGEGSWAVQKLVQEAHLWLFNLLSASSVKYRVRNLVETVGPSSAQIHGTISYLSSFFSGVEEQ